jgi:hypothetical protein
MSARNWTRFSIVSCIVLASAILAAVPAQAQGNCTDLKGSIAAHFDFAGSQGPGWYGWAYMTFGNDPTLIAARLVDLNNGYKAHPISPIKPNSAGNFAGYEILTFTVDGVGSFQLDAQFLCAAGATPFFCGFSEQGRLVPEAGTGQFAGMTGNISERGEAVFEGEPTSDNPWLWVAQMSGSVCK